MGKVARQVVEQAGVNVDVLNRVPVEFPEAPKPQPLPRLRKRSWHQIQAWREAESRNLPDDPARDATAPGM